MPCDQTQQLQVDYIIARTAMGDDSKSLDFIFLVSPSWEQERGGAIWVQVYLGMGGWGHQGHEVCVGNLMMAQKGREEFPRSC